VITLNTKKPKRARPFIHIKDSILEGGINAPGANLHIENTLVTPPKSKQREGSANRSSGIAWRDYDAGPRLPIYCPECEKLSLSNATRFSNAWITINKVNEPCPQCGSGKAHLVNGVFELTEELVKVISAPDLTAEGLAALREILELAASGKITPAAAKTRASKISPKFAAFLDMLFKFGVPAIALVVALIDAHWQYQSVQIAKDGFELARKEALESGKYDEKLLSVLEAIQKSQLQKQAEQTIGRHSEPKAGKKRHPVPPKIDKKVPSRTKPRKPQMPHER
jgi:hypothetical protein